MTDDAKAAHARISASRSKKNRATGFVKGWKDGHRGHAYLNDYEPGSPAWAGYDAGFKMARQDEGLSIAVERKLKE